MATTPSTTLTGLLDFHLSARPTAVALIGAGRSITYADIGNTARRIANRLAQLSVSPGDRIAYIGKNSLEYFELLFGCAVAGAIMAPISWRLTSEEVRGVISDCEPKLVFVEPELGFEPAPATTCVPIVTGSADAGLANWIGDAGTDDLAREDHQDRVSVLLYTSGTTGRPKGVMLTNRNLLAQRAHRGSGVDWDDWTDADISLISMPIAHISGTGWALYGLYAGGTGIVEPTFEAHVAARRIEQKRITRMFVVPAALDLLVDAVSGSSYVTSSLRAICYGGAPISQRTLSAARRVFSCGLVQLYGMTETAGAVIALAPEDHLPENGSRLTAAGQPLPGVEMRIKPLGDASSMGEVLIRGDNVMAGYFRQPEATRDALDAEGWLHTGDVGEIDDDGYLFLRDRLKDMIITGGENVFATEVENVISSHPKVKEIAVIGVPDSRWGEVIKAVIVLRNGQNLTPDEVIDWTRRQLASYKVPRQVEFTDALPRNPTGKVMKKALRAAAIDHRRTR